MTSDADRAAGKKGRFTNMLNCIETLFRRLTLVLAIVVGLAYAPAALADVTFNFLPVNTFSGTAPAGTLSATFSDVTGGVQLVITSNLANGENLDPNKALYLNINPSLDGQLSDLGFALTANTGFSQAASVQTGADGFKADGDGVYDILFTYTMSTKAFTTGESQTYLISDSAGTIHASDFNFLSTCDTGCGTGGWLAAIHVQNTPNGGSGSAYVGGVVPDGGVTLVLLGSVLVGVETLRRKLRV
jgi:hypothetical protein